uniref:ARAD1D10516p n=1 Tax=Blastobotrys adeninivorans TaxID=409370 RepID=A0A060T8D7_BLAAD
MWIACSKVIGTVSLGILAGSKATYAQYPVGIRTLEKSHYGLSTLAIATFGSSFVAGKPHPYLIYSSILTALAMCTTRLSSATSATSATNSKLDEGVTGEAPKPKSRSEPSLLDQSTYEFAESEDDTPPESVPDSAPESDSGRDYSCPYLMIMRVIDFGRRAISYVTGPGFGATANLAAFLIATVGLIGDL